MDINLTPFKKNFVVAVLACVVSYLILIGATFIEVNFTGWGELIRAEYEGRTTEETASEIDVFAEMERVIVRIKFLYVPMAVVLPPLESRLAVQVGIGPGF